MKIETIQNEINTALKEGNTLKVDALRSVVAAVKKAAIDKRCEITEGLVDEMLLKEIKIIKEQIDTCPNSRPELKEEYEHRLDIINQYAPKLMIDIVEITAIIESLLIKANIDIATANKGTIMKTIMPSLKGKADMAIVNKVVAELMNNADNSMR